MLPCRFSYRNATRSKVPEYFKYFLMKKVLQLKSFILCLLKIHPLPPIHSVTILSGSVFRTQANYCDIFHSHEKYRSVLLMHNKVVTVNFSLPIASFY